MGGAGSGSGGRFGPRFTKPQREFVRKRLEEAGWVRKLIITATLANQFMAEFGETRPVGSFLRLLKRLEEKHAGEVERLHTRESKGRTEPKPKEASKQRARSYEGPTRFSQAEEQAIVSVAPDCVIVEHIVDYDTLIRKLDEAFPERRGKWNRDGIRAILKRHGTYDRLLQGERPVPIVVRPPNDPWEHLKLLRALVDARMDTLKVEHARLDRFHHRLNRALEAADEIIGVSGIIELAAAYEESRPGATLKKVGPSGETS